jgi:hypothetical protein
MANYAQIENGKVVNVVVSDAQYASDNGLILIAEGSGIGIDWDYANGQFVDNRPVPVVVTTPAPTKEQLFAELQTLTAKINALG